MLVVILSSKENDYKRSFTVVVYLLVVVLSDDCYIYIIYIYIYIHHSVGMYDTK